MQYGGSVVRNGLVLLVFAGVATACARSTPEGRPVAAPAPDLTEMALLGLGSEGATTHVTSEESLPPAPTSAAPESKAKDGSDIVPPFSGTKPAKPAKKKPAKRK